MIFSVLKTVTAHRVRACHSLVSATALAAPSDTSLRTQDTSDTGPKCLQSVSRDFGPHRFGPSYSYLGLSNYISTADF